MSRLSGTITALVTPFTTDGSSVDFESYDALLERQIAAGVTGVLPLGTTGETPTLTAKEKEEIITRTVSKVAGRVPVMVGTGSNCTTTTITATKQAQDLGADQALVVSPYYNRPSQEGLYRHFKAVSEACSIPIVVYNVAPRTAINIATDTLARIAELPNVIAVKEASGNVDQIAEVIERIQSNSDTFAVMSGDDGVTLPLMSLGGTGVISVASNVWPEEVVAMTSLALEGNFAAAREKHFKLSKLFDNLFIETNPVPSKFALSIMGLCSSTVRLPLVQLSEDSQSTLTKTLKDYNLI